MIILDEVVHVVFLFIRSILYTLRSGSIQNIFLKLLTHRIGDCNTPEARRNLLTEIFTQDMKALRHGSQTKPTSTLDLSRNLVGRTRRTTNNQ